jgi:zinc transport system substrate-binding protein
LKQVPIELEGKSPSGRQLARIMQSMESESIRVIFVQPQFSTSSAEAIADAVGGSVFAIDPLARNYSENLVHVARILRETLELHE